MSQSQSPTELVPSSPPEEGVLEMERQPELVPVSGTPGADHDLLDRADECELIARQICDELGVPCPSYLPEVVQEWVEGAKKETRIFQRASGASPRRGAEPEATGRGLHLPR